ncbi:MAG: 50S ribosomal protein L24 [Chloroflexi bacterium]|nr:50S ribosomal protein L24 [Chloroflexota bacterium]MCI0580487.1 50S ribosomal protein L24 [Chloroflexota bacterium]MCI0649231.1 50S ribosomal protein L24 [Chloroflexota bacterium]MCI0727957.1 50S ribosomal protein L24 [Chloroflexota bacterium]
MRIKKGDQVEVIAGNDKGLRGTVQRVLPKENRVVVSGVNIVKKHQRPRPTGGRTPAQGGIIEFEASIDASNVMLVCPHTGELTRIGYRRLKEGDQFVRVRYSKKSGKEID